MRSSALGFRFSEVDIHGPELDKYALILINGLESRLDAFASARASSPLARRCCILVDLREVNGLRVRSLEERAPLPLLYAGDVVRNRRLGDAIVRRALCDPLVEHCRPHLKGFLTPQALDLFVLFLANAHVKQPGAVARRSRCSLRTLEKRCSVAGLPSPQALLRLGRVLAGVHWMVTRGHSANRGAGVAGYAAVRSYRRAVREALDASLDVLVEDWQTARIGQRLRSMLNQ